MFFRECSLCERVQGSDSYRQPVAAGVFKGNYLQRAQLKQIKWFQVCKANKNRHQCEESLIILVVMNLFSFEGKVIAGTTNHLESNQIMSNVCHICQRKLSRRSVEKKRKLQSRINCSSKVVHHRVKENYISSRLEPIGVVAVESQTRLLSFLAACRRAYLSVQLKRTHKIRLCLKTADCINN